MSHFAAPASARLDRSLDVPLTVLERAKIAIQLGSAMLAGGLLAVGLLQRQFGPPEMANIAELVVALAAWVVALPIFLIAARGLFTADPNTFSEQLVALATLAAMATGDFVTATLIPVIMSLGHFLEERSVLGAQAAIEGLRKLQARRATLLTPGGEREVDPQTLTPGDVMVLRPGDVIAADGEVLDGSSAVDQSSITGESAPEEIAPGGTVFAGSVNLTGLLRVRVTRTGSQTALGRVVELLHEAEQSKTPVLRLIEQYEDALRIAQIMLDHDLRCGAFQSGALHDLAGRAAFVVGQFDLAEKHLKKAEELHTLSGPGAEFLREISYYQEAWRREQEFRKAERMAGDLPRVLLRTTQGDIELELFENEAPNTAANFITLVEQGFYDGLSFFRVLPGSMAQAGCPEDDGSGGPGYVIECECYRSAHRLHFRGSLGMLHRGPHTGGSQFYLAFVPIRDFDGVHTVFGRIARGLDVLARLQRRDPPTPESLQINPFPNVDVPPPDKILEAKVLRKRNHPYRPKVYPLARREAL